jgi:hypothetical protein
MNMAKIWYINSELTEKMAGFEFPSENCFEPIEVDRDTLDGLWIYDFEWTTADGITGSVETCYVECMKAKLKSELSAYRWDLMNGNMYVNGQKIVMDKDGRAELYESIAGYLDLAVDDRPATISFKPPQAINAEDWPELNPENLIGWRGAYAMSNSKHSRDCELSLWADIEALTTKEDIDGFDYITEFDALLKPLLSNDLTKCAYPEKYHNEDV